MKLTADNKLKKIIVVGDRVLIKPKKQSDKTASGLYLPPGVHENERYFIVPQSSILMLEREEDL